MVNETPIEWTDRTWNPITGCWGPGGTSEKPNFCPYCYAANKVALRTERFRDKALKEQGAKVVLDKDRCRYFAPTFYPHRLDQPAKIKTSKKIFVCSMGDLMHGSIPKEWIDSVLAVIENCPQHIFQLLTKNPKRYLDFSYPGNCWLGATATDPEQWETATRAFWELGQRPAKERRLHFISCEPFLEPIRPDKYEVIDWLIIGGITGMKTTEETEEENAARIKNADFLIEWAHDKNCVPVFLKDNLHHSEALRQFPLYGIKGR